MLFRSDSSPRMYRSGNFKLSPRGDENRPFLSCVFIQVPFQIIPARGRLHLAHGLLCDSPTERNLSPRKGTKTAQIVFLRRVDLHCDLSPQGGKKAPHQKKMRSFSFANLNSLFSVGYSSMNGTIAAAVIFSLLRLLHSDKMCYNKANSKHLSQN